MQSRQGGARVMAAAGAAAALAGCSMSFVAPSGLPQLQEREVSKAASSPAAGFQALSATAGLLAVAGSIAGGVGSRTVASKRSAATARRAAPDTIAATAVANGSFTILVAALKKAGLVEVLSGSTAYTVFAPTDAAFSALLTKLGATSEQLLARPDLKNILLYHVVPGTGLSSSLSDGLTLDTVQGSALEVQISGGTVKIDAAKVTAADVACSNGVIHVIDTVLLPPAPAKFDPSKQIGATAPFGFFDPLRLSSAQDEKGFKNYQASEIKHGRVAMMASIGALAMHVIKFPGFEKVPSGLNSLVVEPGYYGFGVVVALSGVLELTAWSQNPRKEPGNFGDPAGFKQYTREMREREINNGRMAMISVAGIIVAEIFTGEDSLQQLGF